VTPADEERLAFARDARLLAMRASGLCRGWLAYDLRVAADGEEAAARLEGCDHEWVDARNEAVISGEMCSKCRTIRAGNEATA